MQSVDKSILITGCSSGIGYASAHYLRERGWRVFASCRKSEDCARLADEGFDAPLLDYEDPDTIATAVGEVLGATNGALGAVFNNGAYAIPGLVQDLPVAALQQLFQANFFGLHDLNVRLIPGFLENGCGRIVQCSSVLGLIPMKWRGSYVSSKFALEGLTSVMRLELHQTDIGVSLIEPGPVTSNIRRNSVAHFERWIDPEKSARKKDYAKLRERLYGPPSIDRFELPPEAVAEKVLHAIESPRPKPRYYVTKPTWIASAGQRILTTRALDWFLGAR